MTSTVPFSREQLATLASLLQSRLAGLELGRASQLHHRSQVEMARETLLQDADDARQRAGEHEVEGIASDVGSNEFKALGDALQRVHRADYGLCVDCQVAIPFDRLQVEPQALRCAPCQDRHERQFRP